MGATWRGLSLDQKCRSAQKRGLLASIGDPHAARPTLRAKGCRRVIRWRSILGLVDRPLEVVAPRLMEVCWKKESDPTIGQECGLSKCPKRGCEVQIGISTGGPVHVALVQRCTGACERARADDSSLRPQVASRT